MLSLQDEGLGFGWGVMAEAPEARQQAVQDVQHAEEPEDDDDIYLDVTMFEEEDEGIVDLETAMLAPEEEEEDPFYFVRARSTGAGALLQSFPQSC